MGKSILSDAVVQLFLLSSACSSLAVRELDSLSRISKQELHASLRRTSDGTSEYAQPGDLFFSSCLSSSFALDRFSGTRCYEPLIPFRSQVDPLQTLSLSLESDFLRLLKILLERGAFDELVTRAHIALFK
jgi:hypothetical protein